MNNPLSKTHFVVTKDRLQHYSNDHYVCSGCGNQYHPKVHSQPYIVQFGAIFAGFLLVAFLLIKSPIWLYVFVGCVSLPYFYFYLKKERKVSKGKLKYGDLVLECPECGNENATKAL